MRGILSTVLAAVLFTGCAGSRAKPVTQGARPPQGATARAPVPNPARELTFVDAEHGFQIDKPDVQWRFRPSEDLSTESIAVPLVVTNTEKNAQVVVQIAPAVATPSQFAERLTLGLKSRAGFTTSDVEPLPVADGAVGFDFAVADQVNGRVAILEGEKGRVYVLLATWPKDAAVGVEKDVDRIMGSIKPNSGAKRD